MEEKTINQTSSIKLTKGQNDKRGWEIKVYNNNLEEVVKEIEKINNLMKTKFNEKNE